MATGSEKSFGQHAKHGFFRLGPDNRLVSSCDVSVEWHGSNLTPQIPWELIV